MTSPSVWDLAVKSTKNTLDVSLVHGLYDSEMFVILHNFEPILIKLIFSQKKSACGKPPFEHVHICFFSCHSLTLWQNLIVCITCTVLSRLCLLGPVQICCFKMCKNVLVLKTAITRNQPVTNHNHPVISHNHI